MNIWKTTNVSLQLNQLFFLSAPNGRLLIRNCKKNKHFDPNIIHQHQKTWKEPTVHQEVLMWEERRAVIWRNINVGNRKHVARNSILKTVLATGYWIFNLILYKRLCPSLTQWYMTVTETSPLILNEMSSGKTK